MAGYTKKAIVVGGGIAGASAAYHLKEIGYHIIILEKDSDIAQGASSNKFGIIYPRIEAVWSEVTQFYYDAFLYLLRILAIYPSGFRQCGVEIVIDNQKRLSKIIQASQEEEYIIPLGTGSIFIEKSGFFSLPELCKNLTEDIEILCNTEVSHIEDGYVVANGKQLQADLVIIAAPIRYVNEVIKGQISYVKTSEKSKELKHVVSSKGYIIPNIDGIHHIGATFEKGVMAPDVTQQGHLSNLNIVAGIVDDLSINDVVGGKTGLRAYSSDIMPVIGKISECLYVSTCHGSRGSLSGVYGGKLISDMISGNITTLQLTDPYRKSINNAKI